MEGLTDKNRKFLVLCMVSDWHGHHEAGLGEKMPYPFTKQQLGFLCRDMLRGSLREAELKLVQLFAFSPFVKSAPGRVKRNKAFAWYFDKWGFPNRNWDKMFRWTFDALAVDAKHEWPFTEAIQLPELYSLIEIQAMKVGMN